MQRDLAGLTRSRFDLLVIGGGIHGLFAARDAAMRGLSVALIERDDFGSGLSFNHQRTVHGGLRALQSGDVRKTREQIAERRAWAIMAPHLVRPLPFLLGTYGWGARSRAVLGTGLSIYDWLGRRRNGGLVSTLHLPNSRTVSRAETMRLFPGIRSGGLTGGAIWHDYQARHPDRLNWLVAADAIGRGAVLANHVEAVAALRVNGRVSGVRARDVLTGAELEIDARVTLVAAGGGVGGVLAAFDIDATMAPSLVRASNLVIDRPAPSLALAAKGRSGRMLTAVPWSGACLLGTFQGTALAESSAARPSAPDVEEMLDDAAVAFPALRAAVADVRVLHTGLTPAILKHGRPELMPEPRVIDHHTSGAPGLVTLVGVKFTTARLAARHAIDVVCRSLDRLLPAPTLSRLPHGDNTGAEKALDQTLGESGLRLDDEVRRHLLDWYGTEAVEVARTIVHTGLTARVADALPIVAGEVIHAAERLMAPTLADVMLRRVPFGPAGHPGDAAIDAAANLMAARFGWSHEQRAREIERVESRYRL